MRRRRYLIPCSFIFTRRSSQTTVAHTSSHNKDGWKYFLCYPQMSMSTKPTLHISIVNFNTKDDLLACLRSIAANPPSYSFKVTVVDNGSSDGSVDAIREQFPNVTVIES